MNRNEYMFGREINGTQCKYGIWNSAKNEFQFNVCEDTPMLAEARLFQKIGEDARKYKFEPKMLKRRIESDERRENRSSSDGFGSGE